MIVSAIIDSSTPLQKAELRYITAGQTPGQYKAIKMTTTPLMISNSTYTVSATIPADIIPEPAITYWIHLVNEQLIEESQKYNIGVKPTSPVIGHIELDSGSNQAAGSSHRPIAYVTNPSNSTVFGTISLLADGQTVYTSPAQLFESGESVVKLEWVTPKIKELTSYNINARLDLYDKSFETESLTLNTFSSIHQVSLSELGTIESETDQYGNIVATANLLYSSSKGE